jgi:hypothetical protein
MIMSRASENSPIDYGTQVGKAKVAMRLKACAKRIPAQLSRLCRIFHWTYTTEKL